MAHPAFLYLAVAAVWAIAVSRWVLADSVVPWDSKNQFYAFFRFLAESLHAGTSIFWNPYHYGGHPSIADPQSLIFSPPFLLWALIDRTPSLRSFDMIVHAHLLAGGLAVAALGRRWDWPAAASLVAAAVFMLGGSASARLNHTGIIICYGLFPLALLTLEVAMERRSWSAGVAFALTASLIALGRNQVALLLCLALAAAALREIVLAPDPMLYLRRRLWLLALMVAIGIVIVAVPVLLSLQLAALSNRPAAALDEALAGSLHPANLATLLAPNMFGAHDPGFNYWGPHYTNTPEVAATDDSFNYLFVGAVPMVLLLWHGLAGGRIAVVGRRLLGALLLAALMFALGRYTPLFAFVFERVPGFNFFRRPVDATFVLLIPLALLSGHLLADYVRRGLPATSPLTMAVILSGAIAIVASGLRLSALTGHGLDAAMAIAKALLIVGIVCTLLFLGNRQVRRAFASWAVALIAVGELLAWNAASRLNAEHSKYYQVLEQASAEDADALRLLATEIEQRHLEGSRPRVEVVGLGGAWQNLAVIRKIESTTGYNPLRIGLYDRYISPGEKGWQATERLFPASFDGYDCALARALGIEYVVLDRPIEDLKQMKRPTQLETLLAGPKVWIYRIRGAAPRVIFSSRVEVADVDATTLTGALINPPEQDRVIIDSETPPVRFPFAELAANRPGVARIVSWRPGEIVIDVDAPTSGVVVLHDTYYPGWVAEVDGNPVPIMRAEVLFRAVEVPAGRHTVAFRFKPLSTDNLLAAAAMVLKGDPNADGQAQVTQGYH